MSSICQSCGMPLTKKEDFGTNKNKTKSLQYCHFCYKNGKFHDEGISLDEKIRKNVEIAKNMGMDEKISKALAEETLPNLKRWKK